MLALRNRLSTAAKYAPVPIVSCRRAIARRWMAGKPGPEDALNRAATSSAEEASGAGKDTAAAARRIAAHHGTTRPKHGRSAQYRRLQGLHLAARRRKRAHRGAMEQLRQIVPDLEQKVFRQIPIFHQEDPLEDSHEDARPPRLATAIPEDPFVKQFVDDVRMEEAVLMARGLLQHSQSGRTRLMSLVQENPGANDFLERVARQIASRLQATFISISREDLILAADAIRSQVAREPANNAKTDGEKGSLRLANARRQRSFRQQQQQNRAAKPTSSKEEQGRDEEEDAERALEQGLGSLKKFLDGVSSAFKSNGKEGVSVIRLSLNGEDQEDGSGSIEDTNSAAADPLQRALQSPDVLAHVFEKIVNAVREMNPGPCVIFFKDHGDVTQGLALYEGLLTSAVLEEGEQILVMTAETPSLRVNGTAPPKPQPPIFYTPALLWQQQEQASASDLTARILLPSPSSPEEKTAWSKLMQEGSRHRIHEHNFYQLLSRAKERRIPISTASIRHVPELGEFLMNPHDAQQILLMAYGYVWEERKKVDASRKVPVTVGLDSLRDATILYQKSVKNANAAVSASPAERALVSSNVKKTDLNNYEKKLLSNVLSADSIRVKFRDIACLRKTKETLQSLIALPLLRPSFFQHGILRDTVSGVLMFGPPGTGKTMLAKAIAKECGSRFLNITPSVIYDMYVGEGEKNAKAVFTLARKLSPCVIFIDEIDSLFDSRDAQRSPTKREVINEFMAEWDGIASQNTGIIVVGATNRPFDLDDAILRRLPRRILIDLPNEEERKAILKNLLASEVLHESVSVDELAAKTKHYSGSDLKNVCISAAMQAVRSALCKENDGRDWLDEFGNIQITAESSSEEDSKAEGQGSNVEVAPADRVLTREHFERALKEVSSSANEQQESLERLRKWNSMFGDDNATRTTAKVKLGF